MTIRPLPRAVLPAVSLAAALLAGCASRSLNAPPVVDWSGGTQSTRPASPPTVAAVPRVHTVRRDDTLASIARQYDTTPGELAQWNGLAPNAKLRVDQVLRINTPTAAVAATDSGAVTQPIGSGSVEQRPLGPVAAAPSSIATPQAGSVNVSQKSGPLGTKRPYSEAALAEMSRPDADAPAAAVATAPVAPVAPSGTPAATSAPTVAWGWPAAGKVATPFGDGKTKGIDIPGKAGDPVLAAADGAVTFVGARVHGYGNFVIVRHTPQLLSVYAHNRANLVTEGAVVKKGQKIAEMGDSDADAVKLHFEIRSDSKPVDPLKYLPER